MLHAIGCPEHAQQFGQTATPRSPLLGIRKDIRKNLFRRCIVSPVKHLSCVLISRQPHSLTVPLRSLTMPLKPNPASPASSNYENSQKDPSPHELLSIYWSLHMQQNLISICTLAFAS